MPPSETLPECRQAALIVSLSPQLFLQKETLEKPVGTMTARGHDGTGLCKIKDESRHS